MISRLATVMAAILIVAITVPCYAQGKSGGKKPGKGPTRPPSSGNVAKQPTSSSAGSGSPVTSTLVDPGISTVLPTTTPFAWLDDASVMEPGGVWVAVSMARWQGADLGQTMIPIVDTAIGLTPRVQVGASVPRVAGGVGTMFFSTKVVAFNDEVRTLQIAVAPTLEILPDAALPEQGRVEWGVPVSAHLDRGGARIYASSGYFTPGLWYAGAGIGGPVNDRLGVSVSFSHAWATSPAPLAGIAIAGARRNEVSGGASYALRPNVVVFGSISRALGVSAEEFADTTFGVGLSWSADVTAFTR